METSARVLAVVPAYNEEGNIGGVVRELACITPFLDVLVVDDGSTDRTAEEAAGKGAQVISHGRNLGIGEAVRTGMEFALRNGYSIAVQVDGDGQHDPSFIFRLLAPLVTGQADVTVGSRFLGAGGYRPPWHRRAGIRLLAEVVAGVTGRPTTDTTSGFRAMNRRALAFLVHNYPPDYPESESLVLMHMAGIRWMEVPVAMRRRLKGDSSIRNISAAGYMIKVLTRIAMDALRIRVPRPAAQRGQEPLSMAVEPVVDMPLSMFFDSPEGPKVCRAPF